MKINLSETRPFTIIGNAGFKSHTSAPSLNVVLKLIILIHNHGSILNLEVYIINALANDALREGFQK